MPVPSNDAAPSTHQAEQPGCLGITARLIWILAGNVVLLGLVVKIMLSRGFSFYDIIYWAVVAALVFIRYADITWLKGLGPDGQPATPKDWAKYTRLLLIIAGGAWVAVHALLLLFRR